VTWTFKASPVAFDFLNDRSFGSFVVGPVGGGKTLPAILKIREIAKVQAASPDGVRRSRFAIIRNTAPELRTTTAQTYQIVYPPEKYGDIVWRSPATHNYAPAGSDVQAEVNLIALDKPADVKKLLSMELTAAFLNEAREIPRVVVSRMTERVGRYRVNERETTWSGLWGDYNAPHADHWLADWHLNNTPEGFKFHQQPPAVLEVRPLQGGGAEVIDQNFPDYQGQRWTDADVMIWYKGRARKVNCPIEICEAADRYWIVNPYAENLIALSRVDNTVNPIGARSYYGRALAGKRVAEIRSYLQGVYEFVSDGKRVVPNYDDDASAVPDLQPMKELPIMFGMDIGGGTLQPAAIWFQRHPEGTYLILGETIGREMGTDRFKDQCWQDLNRWFPDHVSRGKIGQGWGDPAGEGRDEIFEVKVLDFLRREGKFDIRPAPSQDPKLRAGAWVAACGRSIRGKPGVLVNKERCPQLRTGLMGAWHYKRVQVAGEDRYQDKPVKNDASHPCDGGGYGLLGAGEYQAAGGRVSVETTQAVMADGDFDVF